MTSVEVRSTDELDEILWILTELGQRLEQLRDNQLYLTSIPHYLSSGAYKFIIAGPDVASRAPEDATAFGFVTFYRAPMQERIVLAVEAFWFAEDRLDAQLPIWSAIASLARRMEFHGLCVSERSVNTPGALHELLQRGELNGDPVARGTTLLQADVQGIYSAFTDGPLRQAAFLASCVRIFTLQVPVDMAGVVSVDEAPFYRGEGRLANAPLWQCQNVDELSAWFMQHGFSPREGGRFAGTLQAQILQQGYVNQPTLSLTKSFEVAAYYATQGSTRDQAVVFTIDGARLRRYGEIYDSFATMVKHCDWILPSEFKTLRVTVTTLGVLKAGRFLAHCYEQARVRVERYGHLPDILVPKIDWSTDVGNDDWVRLSRAGITEEAMNGLQNTFEGFWMFALGQIGSVDTITVGDTERPEQVETRPVGPFGYYIAFHQVEDILKAALEGQTADYRQPGWDLTAFGYIAKTCRDEEFFSSGPIPGECIVKVTLVDARGHPVRVIASR
jgi:hypothetical protein